MRNIMLGYWVILAGVLLQIVGRIRDERLHRANPEEEVGMF